MSKTLSLCFALSGCIATGGCDEPEDASGGDVPSSTAGKADDAMGGGAGEENKVSQVQHGEHLLEILERDDGSAAVVRVGAWQFEVPWDGRTLRCPCRGYESSVLQIRIEQLADGPRIEVFSARLGLEAEVVEDATSPGNMRVVLPDGTFPTVADYLALMATVDEDDRALLDTIAETDFEAYLETIDLTQQLDLFWDDREELSDVADLLTERVYQPTPK